MLVLSKPDYYRAKFIMDGPLKLELGGGTNPKDGFINVDCRNDLGRCDILFDLEKLRPARKPTEEFPDPSYYQKVLPLPDESVCQVYSSHCLEHVANLDGVLHELARVCHNGATIEIHVPHYLHPDAMCPSHQHTIGENSVKGWTKRDFGGKRFDLVRTELIPSQWFEEAKELHPGWKDDQIMRFVPGTCFEVRYLLRVRRCPQEKQ